eukprot:645055-Prymnesium_polylepis.1
MSPKADREDSAFLATKATACSPGLYPSSPHLLALATPAVAAGLWFLITALAQIRPAGQPWTGSPSRGRPPSRSLPRPA